MPKEIEGQTYYSQEELDQLKEEKENEIADIKEEIENAKDEEKEKLEEELAAAKADLEKFKDKDYNFGKVRKVANDKEKEAEETKQQLEATAKRVEEIANAARKDTLDAYLDGKIAQDDEETKKKFDLYFKKLGGEQAASKSEIVKIAQDSLILAANENADFGNVLPRNFIVPEKRSEKKKEESSFSKEQRQAMNISDKDAEKYDPSKPMDII